MFKILASIGALGKLQTHDVSYFSGCKLEKNSAFPFNRSVSVSSSPLDLIHSNVWEPSPVPAKGKSRYYVSFINDRTHYCLVYLMKHCYEFFEIYEVFVLL